MNLNFLKNSNTSINKITNNLSISSNSKNDNTFNNYTPNKASNDNIISNSSFDISSQDINNSNTQDSPKIDINISDNSNFNNPINTNNNLQYDDNLYQDNQSLTSIAHNIIKYNENEIMDDIMISNDEFNHSHSSRKRPLHQILPIPKQLFLLLLKF